MLEEYRWIVVLIWFVAAAIGHNRNRGSIEKLEERMQGLDGEKIKEFDWKQPGGESWLYWCSIVFAVMMILFCIVAVVKLLIDIF